MAACTHVGADGVRRPRLTAATPGDWRPSAAQKKTRSSGTAPDMCDAQGTAWPLLSQVCMLEREKAPAGVASKVLLWSPGDITAIDVRNRSPLHVAMDATEPSAKPQ